MKHRDRPRSILQRALPLMGLAALVAAAVPSVGAGQNGQLSPQLNGTWALQGSVEQAQQTVQAAIEPAVQGLTPDIQRAARARIAESTAVPQTITINGSADRVSVSIVGAESRTFETAFGQPQNVYSRSGVRASLIQSVRPDGGLEQRFQAMDGTQYNFYTPSGSNLVLDVMLQSRRLQGDIRFRLQYARR